MQRLFDTIFAIRKENLRCSDISGFTLVETIVASVILFTCLGAATLSYNAAIDMAGRTDSIIRIAGVQADIRAAVRDKLFSGVTREEDIRYAEDITYTWRADRSRGSRNILGSSTETTGGLEYGNFNLTLYALSLTITYSQYGQNRQSGFDYKELVWIPIK